MGREAVYEKSIYSRGLPKIVGWGGGGVRGWEEEGASTVCKFKRGLGIKEGTVSLTLNANFIKNVSTLNRCKY